MRPRAPTAVPCGLLTFSLLSLTACVAHPPAAPAPRPAQAAPSEEARRLMAEAAEAKRRREAQAEEEARRERVEQDAENKRRSDAMLAERKRKFDALPAFRAQLKTGDRVQVRSAFKLGTVIELKGPLALVQLEIEDLTSRRYEMRWVPINDLVQPDL